MSATTMKTYVHFQVPHGERRDLVLANCPLTSTHKSVLWHLCLCALTLNEKPIKHVKTEQIVRSNISNTRVLGQDSMTWLSRK